MKFKQFLTETTESFIQDAIRFAISHKKASVALDVACEYNVQMPELEQIIIQDNHHAVSYAEHFGRFKLYEEKLLKTKDMVGLVDYCITIIKGRWIEAEPIIFEFTGPNISKPTMSPANIYLGKFPEARTSNKQTPLTFYHPWGDIVMITDIPNSISDDQCVKLITLLCAGKIRFYQEELKLCRVYYEPVINSILSQNKIYYGMTVEELKLNHEKVQHLIRMLFLTQKANDFE